MTTHAFFYRTATSDWIGPFDSLAKLNETVRLKMHVVQVIDVRPIQRKVILP